MLCENKNSREKRRKMNVCACFLLLQFAIILEQFIVAHAKSTKRFKDPSKYVKCAEKSTTLWPDYRDRKFYYECLGDDYYARRPCPPKKVFNYRKQQCIFPEINSNVNEHKSRKKEKFAPSCLESGQKMFWPDPVKPRDYYKCTGIGKYQKLHCRVNEIFEFSVQMCVVEPDKVIATAPNYHHNFVENGPQCLMNELHLAWPSPSNQQIYYLCTGFGVFEQRECQIGSIFNFLMQTCVQDTRPTSTSSTSTTTTAEPTTTTEVSTTSTKSTTTELPMDNEIEIITDIMEYPSSSLAKTTIEPSTSISPVIYPAKIKCLICWRPTCDANELSMKWPDYDAPSRYFECLKMNVIIHKKCRMSFVFSFERQRCVMN